MAGIALDVMERKTAEQARNHSEERLRPATDATELGNGDGLDQRLPRPGIHDFIIQLDMPGKAE